MGHLTLLIFGIITGRVPKDLLYLNLAGHCLKLNAK